MIYWTPVKWGLLGIFLLPRVGPPPTHPLCCLRKAGSIFTPLPLCLSCHTLTHIYLCFLRWVGWTDKYSQWLQLFCLLPLSVTSPVYFYPTFVSLSCHTLTYIYLCFLRWAGWTDKYSQWLQFSGVFLPHIRQPWCTLCPHWICFPFTLDTDTPDERNASHTSLSD